MSDVAAPVTLTIGGQPYQFLWGTKAIREMQELLSTPGHLVTLEEIHAELSRNRIKFVCAFIWAGLLKFRPDTTLEQVDELLDNMTEAELTTLMREFGLPTLTPTDADAKELRGNKRNPRKARPKRGTGGTSTSTPAVLV